MLRFEKAKSGTLLHVEPSGYEPWAVWGHAQLSRRWRPRFFKPPSPIFSASPIPPQTPPPRHLGSLTATILVSFDLIVSSSSCWV